MCTNFTPVQKPQWVKDAFDIDLPAAYAAETQPGLVENFFEPSYVNALINRNNQCKANRIPLDDGQK